MSYPLYAIRYTLYEVLYAIRNTKHERSATCDEFAGLHILMPAIPDGPADAGRRLCRYWYRESRCQVRTGWQKQNPFNQRLRSVKSVFYKALFLSFYANFCAFCASLRLIKHLFRQLLNMANNHSSLILNALCEF